MAKSKHKSNREKNSSQKRTDKGSSNSTKNNTLTAEDIQNIQFLNIQVLSTYIGLYATSLLYEANIKGYDLIYDKENATTEDKLAIDTLVLNALYISFALALISAYISITRYNNLSEKIRKGEVDFSIQPNVDLFIANVLNITSDIYFIKGTKGLYDRDNIQPVFGVSTIR